MTLMNMIELIFLKDNLGTNKMKNIAQMYEKVHLYVVHLLSQSKFIEEI